MSKRGKQKKAEQVERRRAQMEEALECQAVKQAAVQEMAIPTPVVPRIRQPKQCSFQHCQRYVDPSCTVCPYCGHPLDGDQQAGAPLPSASAA
jgi:hypothetical protein